MKKDSLQILNTLKPKVRSSFSKAEQIECQIECLEERLIVECKPIKGWEYRPCIYKAYDNYEYFDDWKSIDIGEKWGTDDLTGFFKAKLIIPKKIKDAKLFLDLNFGGESLLSINGSPCQGLDFDRNMVPLDENFSENQEINLLIEASVRNAPYDSFRDDIRVYHVFEKANVIQVNSIIEDFYYDCWLIFDIAEESEPGEYKEFLLDNLKLSLNKIDFYEQDRNSFLKGVLVAKKVIKERIFGNPNFRKNGRLCLVGQSHLDLVYLWPYKEFLRKNVRTAMNMLRLLEEFPEFIFSQSQGKLYKELKEKYPKVYEKVKKKIAEGRWEPVGAFYVEPDCNLSSGESLIRQIIFGKSFYRNEFGVDPKICWIPDVFGCMWTMPQILIKSGVKYISTIKLSIWNDTNHFPYNSFWWEGPDGSKVLAHFPTTHFVSSVEPAKMLKNWDAYKEKHITGESMYQFGLADGGGGPTRDIVAKMYRIRNFPGMPQMEFDTIENFFNRLDKKSANLPVWQDELYLEAHRGAYTTKGQIKKANRKCEFLQRDAEIYSVIAKAYGGSSKKLKVDNGWEKVLVNQFHDTLSGTHVNQAFKDTMDLYDEAFRIGEEVKTESLKYISRMINLENDGISIVIYNSLSWNRTDEVQFNLKRSDDSFRIVEAGSGRGIPYIVEKLHDRAIKVNCIVFDVPSMGYKVLNIIEGKQQQLPVRANVINNIIDTEQFKVELDDNGDFISIYDKVYNRELVEGGQANKLQIFEDKPGRYSAWDIIPSYKEKEFNAVELQKIDIMENNYVRTVICIKKKVSNSIVDQKIVFYHDLHRINFITHIEWRECEKLLKVGFPVAIRARSATYDIPFGSIKRPTHTSTSWDKAKFEVYANKWVDLSEGNFGIALLNDCKYGYDICGNLMRISLLKAPIFPDPESDLGEHTFKYAIYPHNGNWTDGRVMQAGYEFNVPLDAIVSSKQKGILPGDSYSWFKVSDPNVIIETIKEPESLDESIIVRIYDAYNQRGEVKIYTPFPVKQAQEVNLIEEAEIPSTININQKELKLYLKPLEIKTLRIKFNSG